MLSWIWVMPLHALRAVSSDMAWVRRKRFLFTVAPLAGYQYRTESTRESRHRPAQRSHAQVTCMHKASPAEPQGTGASSTQSGLGAARAGPERQSPRRSCVLLQGDMREPRLGNFRSGASARQVERADQGTAEREREY